MQTGKSAKGTVIHLVTEIPQKGDPGIHYFARCDKKINVTLTDEQDLTSVSCAKCQKYADYKAAMTELEKPDPSSEKEPANSEATANLDAGTANQEATANQDGTANGDAPAKKPAKKKPAKKKPEKLSEENYKDHLKNAVKPKKSDAMKHFVSRKTDKAIYIVHTPTKTTVFSNVEKRAVDTVLKYLNNLKLKWKGPDKSCPKGWTSAIRGAFNAAYKSLGIPTDVEGTKPTETPEKTAEKAVKETLELMAANAKEGDYVVLLNERYVFDGEKFVYTETEATDIPKSEAKDIPKTEGKPKRKIKRRKKKDKPKTDKPKRVIKRRSKSKDKPKTEKPKRVIKRRPKTDRFGFEKGSIRSYIAGRLEKGGTIKSIVAKVAKKAGIDQKRANSKVKAIIRKFRQTEFRILIYQESKPENDIYKITERL